MATLKQFPKAIYKGNSVSCKLQIRSVNTGELYQFQVGDIVRLGVKGTLEDTEYQIYKEYIILRPGDAMTIHLTPKDTDSLTATETKGILEIELVYNDGASIKTVYQDKINLEGVVINE